MILVSQRQELLCAPLLNQQPIENLPESVLDQANSSSSAATKWGSRERSRLGKWLLLSIKRRLKDMLGF